MPHLTCASCRQMASLMLPALMASSCPDPLVSHRVNGRTVLLQGGIHHVCADRQNRRKHHSANTAGPNSPSSISSHWSPHPSQRSSWQPINSPSQWVVTITSTFSFAFSSTFSACTLSGCSTRACTGACTCARSSCWVSPSQSITLHCGVCCAPHTE